MNRRAVVVLTSCLLAAVCLSALAGLVFKLSAPPDDRARLLWAYRDTAEPLPLRLVDFPFVRHTRGMRGSSGFPGVEAAAAAVLMTSSDTRTRAVAQLLTGKQRDAIEALETAAQRDPSQPDVWNDLGVALHERGRLEDDPESFAQALAAIDQALRLDPEMREAAYNRAVVLDALQLSRPAADARRHYLAIDPDSAWADDVRRALDRHRAETKARPSWNAVKPMLGEAASGGDIQTVDEIVRRFPQESRTWVERQLLHQWAVATLARDQREAARVLTIGRTVAARLFSITGEGLALAAADTIRTAMATDRASALCDAYVAYDAARGLAAARKPTAAESVMAAAERGFVETGSPMALVARYYRAAAVFDQRRTDEAQSLLAMTEAALRPEYKSLRTQCLWERSRILGRLGKRYESMQLAAAAAEQFRESGELVFAGRNEIEVASRLTWLGRTQDAWRIRRQVFETAASTGSEALLQAALLTAARDELFMGREDLAASLFAMFEPTPDESPLTRFDALLWRSYLAARRGESASLDVVLARLRDAMTKVTDPALRAEAEDQMRLAEAMMIRERAPRRAVELLNAAITFRRETGRVGRLAEAFLERGRAYAAAGSSEAAENDFAAALTALEQQRVEVGRVDLRDAFFDVARGACDGLLQLQSLRGTFDDAFNTVERCRARSLLDAVGTATTPFQRPEISSRLDEKTVVASYASAGDAILLSIVTSKGISAFRLPHTRSSVAQRGEAFITAITAKDEKRARREARELHDILIGPLAGQLASAGRLVVVEDESTAGVPFAALENPDGQRLIERIEIVVAPSASTYVARPTATSFVADRHTRVLTMGDPTLAGFNRNLPRLPFAAREAQHVSSLYRGAAVYIGDTATRTGFVREAPRVDLIHLATHAVVHPRTASSSFLLFSPDGAGDSGLLQLSDIANLKLTHAPLVVLAGCRTGVAARGRGAIRSFAYAFLAAGSRGVVGTLWDVDDEVTVQFSAALHRHLSQQKSLAAALRAAQLEMLRSGDPRLRNPMAWGPFVSFGS